MTNPQHDIRQGDRLTILAGAARSGHTFEPLTRSCYLDVLHARRQYDGTIEVYGIQLTARGAWRKGAPDRTVSLPAGSYTTPVRVDDTVTCSDPDRTGTVTALHLDEEDGTVTADILFADGITSCGVNLAALTHVGRASEAAETPADLGHQPDATAPYAVTALAGCWTSFCIAGDCDGIHHVDATGHIWTERRKAAEATQRDLYAVTWHVAGETRQRHSTCVVLSGYSTTEDIPTMIGIRDGVPDSAIVIDVCEPIQPSRPQAADTETAGAERTPGQSHLADLP